MEGNVVRLEESRARLRITHQQVRAGRSRRDTLHHSAYARLEARLATMPVIEQAKGIIMERTGCAAEEAFDMLRRVSQHSNMKVRDLASEIVCRTVAGEHDGARSIGA